MEKDKKYQLTTERIEQAIRNYLVPSRLDSESALNLVLSKIDNKETNPKIVRISAWWKYAGAAAAILVIGLFLHLLLATVTFKGIDSQVASFRLPDQSRVVLNQNSQVKFRKYFWNRQVSLEGNAYFEVEKGSRFVVSTETGQVEVLGTRFSVKENNKRLEVACFEGKVKAVNREIQQILKAGDSVTIIEGKKESAKITAEFPDFALFSRHYSNVELSEIIKDIDLFFGVKTTLETETFKYFTGSLETGTLETALAIVTTPLQLDYTFEGENKIRINQSINK